MATQLLLQNTRKTWANLFANELTLDTLLKMKAGSIADFTGCEVIGLNTGPTAENTRMVYVNKGGTNDPQIADGTILYPYFTINYALSQITDNSDTKKYAIMLGPGLYEENIVLKPNVSIVGPDPLDVTIKGNISLSSDWIGGSPSCMLFGISFDSTGLIDLNYFALSIDTATVVFQNCLIGCPINALGKTTGNLTVFRACVLLGNITIVGGFPQLTLNFGANISVSIQDDVLRPVFGFLIGFSGFAALSVLNVVGGAGIELSLINSLFSSETFDGSGVLIHASSNSLCTVGSLSVLNSATIDRLNDANGLAYTPNAPGDWPTVPTTCQQALDYLSGGMQSVAFTPTSNALVGITSIDSMSGQYIAINGQLSVNFVIKLTLPLIPSGICSFQMSLPITMTVPADRFSVTGCFNASCNDGFDNLSGSDMSFGSIQSIIGDGTQCLVRFELGAGATSTSVVLMGQYSYRL